MAKWLSPGQTMGAAWTSFSGIVTWIVDQLGTSVLGTHNWKLLKFVLRVVLLVSALAASVASTRARHVNHLVYC